VVLFVLDPPVAPDEYREFRGLQVEGVQAGQRVGAVDAGLPVPDGSADGLQGLCRVRERQPVHGGGLDPADFVAAPGSVPAAVTEGDVVPGQLIDQLMQAGVVRLEHTWMRSSKGRAQTLSWRWPGVTRIARGRPLPSQARWILVVSPPRDRPRT
jgi:hypothetical protein